MKHYLLAFTIFKFGDFKTYYRIFDKYDHVINFVINHPNIRDNYMIFEQIK